MKANVWLWIGISLCFEILGDVFLKRQRLILAMGAYNVMLMLWFLAVRIGDNSIALPGTIWLLGGHISLVLIGCFFGEHLIFRQWLGVVLAFVALLMISLGNFVSEIR